MLVGDIGDVQVAIFRPDNNLFFSVLGSPVKPLVTRRRVAFGLTFQARRLVERDGQLLAHRRTDIDNHRRIYNVNSNRKEMGHNFFQSKICCKRAYIRL